MVSMRILSAALLLLLLSGCGYKPSAHYAKEVMHEKVSTQVIIALQDPENSVAIKDALDTAVITRFKSSLTHRSKAQTHLQIMLKNITFSALQYDLHGYVISYRTRITLQIERISGDTTKIYIAKGTYDFTIEPNAIISDQVRYEAINKSAQKAIDSFVAQVAAEGVRKEG